MEQAPLDPSLIRKDQEFIDHALLAPTYMRDSNNFIMDFMEAGPLVFPNKTSVHIPNATVQHTSTSPVSAVTGNDGSFTVKITDTDQLPPDLNFHNSLFHFRQPQSDVVTVASVATATESTLSVVTATTEPSTSLPLVITTGNSNTDGSNGYNHKHQHPHGHPRTAPFLTLNDSFLENSGNKGFCGAVTVNHISEDVTVQEFLLGESNVTLDDDEIIAEQNDDVLYARSNSRKVLPHKKRISRTLRVSPGGVEGVLPPPLDVHKLQMEERLTVSAYSCEICGGTAVTQLQFFEHLKQHYEPAAPHNMLAAMKSSLEDLETRKCNEICEVNKKAARNNVDQVFNDVHLNFAAFDQVEDTVRHVMNTDSDDNDIKVISTNDMTKCMEYVTQTAPSPLKSISTEEVEFSDTEDMLEGIRNVVDKVSIEDTCDDIDLMASNGMRATWFSHDNFSGISFKNKPFSDVSFSETLPHMPIMENNQLSKVPEHILPHSLNVLTFQKEDSPEVKLQIPTQEESEPTTYYNDSIPMHLSRVNESSNQQSSGFLQPLQSPTVQFYNLEDDEAVDQKFEVDQIDSPIRTDSHCENDDAGDDDEELAVENVSVDENSGKKQLFCTKCNRTFNSRNALKYHCRTHTGLRPHQCLTCGKSFLAQSALKAHVRTHTGDKPFECEHCHRTFRQWGDLKYHTVSLHTNEKSHQCEFCGKSFSRKYSLVLHIRIHTSERNFKCDVCNKSFRASTYLQNHLKIHTGEKPHGCDVCSKRFRMIGDLRRHMRIHQDTNNKLHSEQATTDTIGD